MGGGIVKDEWKAREGPFFWPERVDKGQWLFYNRLSSPFWPTPAIPPNFPSHESKSHAK
jgi:hypothetical protein